MCYSRPRHLLLALLHIYWTTLFTGMKVLSEKTEDTIGGINSVLTGLTQEVKSSTPCHSTWTSSSHQSELALVNERYCVTPNCLSPQFSGSGTVDLDCPGIWNYAPKRYKILRHKQKFQWCTAIVFFAQLLLYISYSILVPKVGNFGYPFAVENVMLVLDSSLFMLL